VAEVGDFTDIFLFSLETQHSIGYGTREITKQCASAMILMSVQSIFGTLVRKFFLIFFILTLRRDHNTIRDTAQWHEWLKE
jgi:hypothetical protein